ncbi:PP2C family protein-serine/threonine phosphatase [Streptomyces anulatus]|uniref:PP2C family protein-serine/threonine phosphatase n=1 Tax=Streptomyces anulatus TaxID=1892 RepID=UPI0036757F54
MRNYATAQLIGGRRYQCDAVAVHTAPNGATSYVLLDGVGDKERVHQWVPGAAAALATAAAEAGDAETGLRAEYERYAAEKARHARHAYDYEPLAAAVVVVDLPDKPRTIAWSGDARAYLVLDGTLQRITADHNLRRVYPPCSTYPRGGNRNKITSCLGAVETDAEVLAEFDHPAIEFGTLPDVPARLVLASDGAYEPIEDNGAVLTTYLHGTPAEAAPDLVDTAVAWGGDRPDNATVLIADLH